jgi:hypothetical protein
MYQYFIATILVLSISCNHSTKESKPITETKTLDTLVQVEKKICKSYVPESIQLFISQNYNGYSIQNVGDDPLCTGEEAVDILIRKKGFSDIRSVRRRSRFIKSTSKNFGDIAFKFQRL